PRLENEPKGGERSDADEGGQRRGCDKPEGKIELRARGFRDQAEAEKVRTRSVQERVEERPRTDECRQPEKRAFRTSILEALRLRSSECGRQQKPRSRRARRHEQREQQARREIGRTLGDETLRQPPDQQKPQPEHQAGFGKRSTDGKDCENRNP